jgi:iron complex outermembrane receptor protein
VQRFLIALVSSLACAAALAHDFHVGKIVIDHPWSRPTAPGMPMGVAYFTLTNHGSADDALIAASTPVAARVEFHQTTLADGVARMRPLAQVPLPAGKTVKVEPGGIHLMLVELRQALAPGSEVPLTLEFRDAGKVEVRLKIESRTAGVENEMTRSMGTVTVVARRPSTLPTSIPTTIEGMTGDRVAASINATDAPDALKYFPSLSVRKRYTGDFDHAVLASRASGSGNSARSLVYADGILLSNLLGNGATYTPRWGLVTPEEIERVDVLYGPFSASYPGNSVGAVVDYITRMPDDFAARASFARFSEDFGAYGHGGSFDGWQASASLGDARESTSWWLNVNRLVSAGHPIAFATKLLSSGVVGGGGTPVTGAVAARNPRNQDWWVLGPTNAIHTVQDHAKLKLSHAFSEHTRLSYTLGWWGNDATRRADTWLRDANGAPVFMGPVNIAGRSFVIAPTEIADSTQELSHLMHGLSARTRQGAWDLEATGSRYSYEKDRSLSSTSADLAGTGWATLHLRARHHGRGERAHLLEMGLQEDRYRLRTEVLNPTTNERVSAFRGETRLTSLYAQDSFDLGERWHAMLGARLERWSARDGAIAGNGAPLRFPEREDTWVSPKVAASFALTPYWTLKASLGRAIRMPTVAELFQGSIAAEAIVNHDPDLAPERSWTRELTAAGEFAHGDLRCTLFSEDTRDALYSQVNVQSGTNLTTIQNVDHMRTRGVEVAAHLRSFDTLELSASLTWTHSRILANGNNPATVGRWQPRVPEWRANALATWRPVEQLSATLGARYSGLQFNTLDNADVHGAAYTGISRFVVIDSRLRYQFDTRWTAALGVDNLGNERYWAFHPYSRRSYHAELAFSL